MFTSHRVKLESVASTVESKADSCKADLAKRDQVSGMDGEAFACPYCDMRHADISGYTLHVIRRHGDGRVI